MASAAYQYLTATTEPNDYIGVFNPVSYTFDFGSLKVASFDSYDSLGNATVKVSSIMATLIDLGSSVIIGGNVNTAYLGVFRVISKTNLSGGLTRLAIDTPYAGISTSGVLVPNTKLSFDIWTGFQGSGSDRLPWLKRDTILVSPTLGTLDYTFEVQSFLKKWYEIEAPDIGNDYNISLKFAVVGSELIPTYTLAKNGYYGFKNPTIQEISERYPLGYYPISFVDGDALIPVLHSVIDGSSVDNFETGIIMVPPWDQFEIPVTRTEPFFFDGNQYLESGIQNTQGSVILFYPDLLLPNTDTIIVKVDVQIRILLTNSQTRLDLWIEYLDTTTQFLPIETFTGNIVKQSSIQLFPSGLLQLFSNIRKIGFSYQIVTGTDIRICGLSGASLSTPNVDGGSGTFIVRNILTQGLPTLITNPTFYFDALAGNVYVLNFNVDTSGALTITPDLPDWVTYEIVSPTLLRVTINTSESVPGDYSSVDYNETDYNASEINNLVGCYQFQFEFGIEVISISFCISPISEIINVCDKNILNFAFLNSSGGYNSIALECTYINGRSFGNETLTKNSTGLLKRSEVIDVYDTLNITASVLTKRMLDLLKALRSSIHVLLYNDATEAFDIPVVIDKNSIQTYGNKFKQANTTVSFTLRKAQELFIQTQ